MAIALDGSTPVAVDHAGSTSSTAVTASFSPPAGSIVVIAVNIGFSATTATGPTVTCKDSLSNTYAAGPSAYDTFLAGAYIFTYFYVSAPGSITVTVTRSLTGTALFEIVPYVLTGAGSSQAGAGSASTYVSTATGTTVDHSITSTVSGSWVIVSAGLGNNETGAPTPVNVTTKHYYNDTSDFTSGMSGYAVTGTAGPETLGWTVTPTNTDYAWAALEILPGVTTMQGTATLSGSGSLAPAAGAFGGAAALSGSGSLATPASNWMINALSGSGTLSGTGFGGASAQLSGSGTLGLARTVIWTGAAVLSGSGLLVPNYIQSVLSGTGTLAISGITLHPPPLLMSGTGTLAVLQVLGGLVSASPGASTPYAYPGTSQVAVAPPGSSAWQYLGSAGAVTALTYSFTCPGGCDKMSCTVMVPAAYRTQLFNPGWQVRVTRGGHQVWDGKLDEPVPTASGWNLTAVGTGNRGQDFLAIYSGTWPAGQPDESVNGAISRGLPWANPGVGQPAGAWFGQAVDSGAQTITALLNLLCTRGAMTWYVNSQPGGIPGDDLSVFPLPTVPNRLLVCTTPVARTLGGDINTIWIRYQISADTTSGTTSVPATYGITVAQNAQSVAAHGVIETFIDLSDVGVQTATAAQAVGASVLAIYQRASWAGPFTASYGQLLNTGGVPIDPGADQAGTYMRLILTDYGYGGEVTPQFPVQFLVGAYEWDDFAQVATVTPFTAIDQSLTGLLSLANTELKPITAAGP